MQSNWGLALKILLISLLFHLLRSCDANLSQYFKGYLGAKWRKLSTEKYVMITDNTIQNLRNVAHKQVTIYATENFDTRASGQAIHSVFLARNWLRSGGKQQGIG